MHYEFCGWKSCSAHTEFCVQTLSKQKAALDLPFSSSLHDFNAIHMFICVWYNRAKCRPHPVSSQWHRHRVMPDSNTENGLGSYTCTRWTQIGNFEWKFFFFCYAKKRHIISALGMEQRMRDSPNDTSHTVLFFFRQHPMPKEFYFAAIFSLEWTGTQAPHKIYTQFLSESVGVRYRHFGIRTGLIIPSTHQSLVDVAAIQFDSVFAYMAWLGFWLGVCILWIWNAHTAHTHYLSSALPMDVRVWLCCHAMHGLVFVQHFHVLFILVSLSVCVCACVGMCEF